MLILLVFFQVFWRKVFKGLKIKRTFLIRTLVDIKLLAFLLFLKDSAAVRASKGTDFKVLLILVEP